MPLREAWTGKPAKPTGQIIELLVRCVCGNGNYPLSLGVSPMDRFVFGGQRKVVLPDVPGKEISYVCCMTGNAVSCTREGEGLIVNIKHPDPLDTVIELKIDG